MKIGFEAKRAFTNGTGLGHYSRTLITSLANYFSEHQYFLFTPKQTNLFHTSALQNVTTILPKNFPSSFFTSWWRSSWVKKDAEQLDIDIYHGLSHEIPYGIDKTHIKTVVTIHDLIFERYPQQFNPIDVFIYRKKFKYACKHANHIIAISEQTKQDIVQFYKIAPKKITVCYQSCASSFSIKVSDAEKKRVQQMYQLPQQFYLYVGSIIERKNLLTICKAINEIKRQHNNANQPTIPLVVIGNGRNYKKKVQQYIAAHQLTTDVIFLSDSPAAKNATFQSAQDFPAIYQQAIGLIYPSIFEGFGIPVLEAMCSGIPVITSNVSCMPETGGDAAYYISPFDVKALSNAMQSIAYNNLLREEMVQKGNIYQQKFSQQNCAAEVMKVYEQLMK